jgi:rhodanese-related sulfurtransferase
MAGVVRLPVWKFLLFDAIGAALWSGVAHRPGLRVQRRDQRRAQDLRDAGQDRPVDHRRCIRALHLAAKWWQRELFIWQLRMDRVTVDELHELMEANRAAKVIDVRSPMSQALTGRIPGAITVDPKKMRVELIAIEPESEVIVYCQCPNEYTAAAVAKVLIQHGFKRVRPLLGGIDAWIEAGHKVEAVEIGGAKVVPIKVQETATT